MGPKRINQLNPVQSNLLNNDRLVIDRLNPGGTFTTYYITGQEIINATLAQIPTPVFIAGAGTYSVKLNKSNVLATGHYSYASGQNVEAIGNHSFIHSKDSTVTGNRSVVLGGENITGNEDDTVYVPNLNVQITDTNNTLEDILVKDNNGKIHIRNVNTINGGSDGLGGTNYVFVQANGTPTENAQELQDAYDLAKTMSPSATNRIAVIAAPGYYNFNDFLMDTEYIDLVSLDGNRSIINTGGLSFGVIANNVFVKGVDVSPNPFLVSGGLNFIKIENCKGGNLSFGTSGGSSGTFINCVAGNNSFGTSGGSATGYFENCQAGNFSFGTSGGNASGIFINCVAGNDSFARSGEASGTFINCKAGDRGFARGDLTIASGYFKNCEAGDQSFGAGNNSFLPGTFINCKAGNLSFGSAGTNGDANGTFINCEAGNQSFGWRRNASGYFENCKGGNESFAGGGTGGNNASGIFIICVAGNDSFGRLTASGYFENCKGGNLSFGVGISASGIFKNCEADISSFGGPATTTTGTFINCIANDDSFGGQIQGKLYRCQLTNGGIFQNVTVPGKIVLCIDGNDDIINQ